MSKKLYEESNIESIADAIREKNGTENTYKVSQMPAAVRAIRTQPVLQEKTAIENGEVVADTGYDGLSKVIVDVDVPPAADSGDEALLFHFDDNFYNIGTIKSEVINTTGLEISSEQSKFGGKSLKCGTTQIANNIKLENFAFGNKDFTIDFWFYATNAATASLLYGTYRSIAILIRDGNTVQVAMSGSSSGWNFDKRYTQSISTNTWHHIAIVRNGSNILTFYDGVKIATENFGTGNVNPVTYLTLGSSALTSGNDRFQGYIDELRVRLGEAAWTEDFTPPTEPYTVKYTNAENLEF